MTTTLVARTYDSPVGELTLVASDRGARAVLWENDRDGRVRFDTTPTPGEHPILNQMAAQLDEYFDGRRREFDLPLQPEGTEMASQEKTDAVTYLRTLAMGRIICDNIPNQTSVGSHATLLFQYRHRRPHLLSYLLLSYRFDSAR